MLTLLVLGMLAVGGLIALVAVLALLKLLLLLVLLPLRLALRMVLLPVRLLFGLLMLPFVLVIAAVCGIGLFAVSLPLLPLALVVFLVWLLMKKAPAASAPRPTV